MTDKKYIGFADVQNAADLRIVEVDVPEWGGVAKLRTLTAGDRASLENAMFREEITPTDDGKEFTVRRVATGVNYRTLLVGKCLINGDGRRLFDDEEIGILDGKDAQVIDRLFKAAQGLNSLQAGAVELEKKD